MGRAGGLAVRPAEKLTVYEWTGATASRWNLADGHPRQQLTPAQVAALGDVTGLFITSARRNEGDVKAAFEEAFFGLAGQPAALRGRPLIAHYSGSAAIEVMANYLRLEGVTVTMAHPTFDSLADTLKRHRVPLVPMPVEDVLGLSEASPPPATGALYVVLPNNPTGHCPDRDQFTALAGWCARHRVLLLADFCFRFFGGFWDYDQYQILDDAGVEYICTEDTGKTWPAGDVKLGMLAASAGPWPLLKDISDDFLFSVAPFTYEVVTRLIGAEDRTAGRVLSQDVADVNRRQLRAALAGSPLEVVNPGHRMGLDWVRAPARWDAGALAGWLHDQGGPQVLPGGRFYWADHAAGSRYVRVALLRDPQYFGRAAACLAGLAGRFPAPAGFRRAL